MISAADFIKEFSDYLGDAKKLPFIIPPYRVEGPAGNVKDLQGKFGFDPPLIFYIKENEGDTIYAHINVAPYDLENFGGSWIPNDKSFIIKTISTDYHLIFGGDPRRDYARELVRRTVLYAYEHGYEKVKTSIFSEGATSFWYNLGFRNADGQPRIDWTLAKPEEATEWQRKLKESPDALWEFAHSEVGRRALFADRNSGVLDLGDEVQRNYAFSRLKLSPDVLNKK